MDYRLSCDGQERGAFSLDELRLRREAGELTGSEWVWCEGMTDWQPLDAVLESSGASTLLPPPIPATAVSRNTGRFPVWGVALAVVLGIVTLALVALGTASFYRGFQKQLRQASSGASKAIVAKPASWNTNTMTEADVRQRSREFRVRQYLEGYRHNGQRNQPCDAEALQLIEAWIAHHFGGAAATNSPSPHELGDQLANSTGCDDPLVLTVTAALTMNPHEKTRRLERALAGYENSGHKGYPRFYAAVSLAAVLDERAQRIRELDGVALRAFKQTLNDGSLLPEDQPEMADILLTGWGYQFFYRNRVGVHQIAGGARNQEWLSAVLEGEYHVMEAWKARGGGYAPTVTDPGWQGFHDHLAKARAAFTRAWELHPEFPLAPARMVYVAMGDAGAEEMRVWFDRAITAQIDHPGAWANMRWGLRPRWHGSLDAMLAFGITALETKRFDTDVPRKWMDIVSDLESEFELPPGEHLYGRADIWPHVQQMYEGYIAEAPTIPQQQGWRGTYAVVAFLAKKYGLAREQLEVLNWELPPGGWSGWGKDISLMPLEVAARTGQAGPGIAEAESRRNASDAAEALRLYTPLSETPGFDDRTRKFIQHRLASLKWETELAAGRWIDFLPSSEDDLNWIILLGKMQKVEPGVLEVAADANGHLLLSRVPIGPAFEVTGEIETVYSSTRHSEAGLTIGIPEQNSSDWYAFRIKRSEREGNVASFSRVWSDQGIRKAVVLGDRSNSFHFQFQDHKANVSVNGVPVLENGAPVKQMRISKECLLGLGAFNDSNHTVIRYRNIKVRRI